MNWYSLFYWLTVADNAKSFFIVSRSIFFLIALISTICYFINATGDYGTAQTEKDRGYQKMSRKWMWWSYTFAIFFWALYIFTPSKKDALLIVAGGGTMNYLTSDSTARQIPHNLINFVSTELQNMASDANVELIANSQKEKALEEVKKMSGEELLNRLKTDSTLKSIILSN